MFGGDRGRSRSEKATSRREPQSGELQASCKDWRGLDPSWTEGYGATFRRLSMHMCRGDEHARSHLHRYTGEAEARFLWWWMVSRKILATLAGKSDFRRQPGQGSRDPSRRRHHDVSSEAPGVSETSFFALHTLEEEHQKAKGRHVISQRQYEQLSDSAHRKKAKDQEALTKVVAKTMEKHKTRNFVLARRNQVNRLRTGAKAKVLREEEKHLPEPPRAKSRLTIFEKLEVVQFAEKLMQNREVFPPPKRIRSKAAPVRKRFRKGVNIQARCKLHFGERLGGIKVCNLIRKAREQQWDKLTIKQQKQHIQLTDSLKVSLGLEGTVKGWRSLTEAHVSQSLQENGSLRRWTVPGPVLEAGFRGVFLERILHSSLGSAARAEEYAHAHKHARTHAHTHILSYIYIYT